jgi:chromosome segregation ATPase
MSVTAPAPKKSDERAALRSAVADLAKAKAAVIEHRAAIERAEEMVAMSKARHAAATAAVATAREQDAKALAAAISTGGSSSARAARQARAAETEAGDDVEMARNALAQLTTDLAEVETDMQVASKAVDRVLAETLRPVALRLLEEVRGHRARFLMAQAALCTLGRLWNSWDDLVKEIGRTAGSSDADAQMSIASEREWEAALKAMRENADAALPDLAGD